MASKKRHKKHHRVHGPSLSKMRTPILLGSVALGYFGLGDMINAQIDKMLPAPSTTTTTTTTSSGFSLSSVLPIAAEAGIGTILALKRRTGVIGAVAGGVLLGAGLRRALKQAGVIKGYQSVPVIGARNRRMAGYQDTPVIAGLPNQLTGLPNQLTGYRVNGANGYTPNGSGLMYSGSGYMQ